MTFSIILLGVLFIFTIFNIGESFLRKLSLNKKLAIVLLLLTLIMYFIPNIVLFNISFSFVGFIFPLIFSIMTLIKTKKVKLFLKILVSSLIVFALNMIYNLISFSVYDVAILQPYLIFGILLGLLLPLICGKASRVYTSTFIGLIVSEIVYYYSHNTFEIEENILTLGSEKVIAVLLVVFIISVVFYSFLRKVKAFTIKQRLKKAERQKYAS